LARFFLATEAVVLVFLANIASLMRSIWTHVPTEALSMGVDMKKRRNDF
jgi:hypothetical protein